MMNDTIAAQLDKFAAADLRVARRDGHMLVAGTKRGTVAIMYEAGVYTITTCGPAPEVVATGKPATVRPALHTVRGRDRSRLITFCCELPGQCYYQKQQR